MTSYVVTSDNYDHPRGTVLTEDDLAGANIDALVQAGHLAPEGDAQVAAEALEGVTEPSEPDPAPEPAETPPEPATDPEPETPAETQEP